MSLLKAVDFDIDQWGVNSCGCRQFATVLFDRSEDEEESKITIITGQGFVNQKIGHNRYNPSSRRQSVCTYIQNECGFDSIIKFCVIQHKGQTHFEIHSVLFDEMDYLFHGIDLGDYRFRSRITNAIQTST